MRPHAFARRRPRSVHQGELETGRIKTSKVCFAHREFPRFALFSPQFVASSSNLEINSPRVSSTARWRRLKGDRNENCDDCKPAGEMDSGHGCGVGHFTHDGRLTDSG